MGVVTPVQPDAGTQDGTTYKSSIDGAVSVAKRPAWIFAPHEQSTPNMTVRVDAGYTWNATTLTEVAAQSTGTITAPVGNPRIDRVVVDATTGAVSVVTGTPAASPTPPAIPGGKIPICQVLLQTSSTTITNSMITDERPFVTTIPLAPDVGSWKFIEKKTASASVQIDFALPTGFNAYKIAYYSVVPANDDVGFWARLSNDGGSTFRATTVYPYQGYGIVNATAAGFSSGADNEIVLVNDGFAAGDRVSNVAGEGGIDGEIYIFGARDSARFTKIKSILSYAAATANAMGSFESTGMLNIAELNNAIRFLFGTGNITSGAFVLYGLVEA
jgi:hypothetical protein